MRPAKLGQAIALYLMMIFGATGGAIMFYAPGLWVFATLMTDGTLPSFSSIQWTFGAMLVGWIYFTILFSYEYWLIRTNPYIKTQEETATVSDAFEHALEQRNILEAFAIIGIMMITFGTRRFITRHWHG